MPARSPAEQNCPAFGCSWPCATTPCGQDMAAGSDSEGGYTRTGQSCPRLRLHADELQGDEVAAQATRWAVAPPPVLMVAEAIPGALASSDGADPVRPD